MENKKSFGVIGLVVLCLAVSALFGVAYAAFTKDLTISGSATVSSSKWDVRFSSIEKNTSITTSGLTITNVPTIDTAGSTTIGGWSVAFTEPGQKAAFDVTVKNYGDFDAKYNGGTDLTNIAPICSVAGDKTHAEAIKVCNNISIELKKGDNTLTTSNASVIPASTHGTETYTLIVSYNKTADDETGSSLPTSTVDVEISTITLTYQQQI